ncbi:major facilitator superfamily domain-containing protein [Aspergillus lucknowensis]|uniref:Major facilitator superfamily domain-containing protein n=1 Tax=Aspergillus lucknowensis TaxID=176173 RepID=A0ABR4LMV7_9EURO
MPIHSYGREGDIPGTVDLSLVEGDDPVTGAGAGAGAGANSSYGQALYPVPTDDPNDPLNWPAWKKNAILVIIAAYSFLGNCSLVGPSVYISIYSEEFGISHADASGLISYPNLAFGFGSLILVPMYLKFGRRIVTLLSMAIFVAGLIGASRATTFSGLMIARVFHGFGSGVCESLPVQLVNDIFYLHERGKRIGYYTVCLCLGSTGPLYASYMLGGGYSWRLFFYVVAAFAGALLVASFFIVEESRFKRPEIVEASGSENVPSSESLEKPGSVQVESAAPAAPTIPRKPFLQTLVPWSPIDHEAEFFATIVRSFAYFCVPAVLWVITSFGIYIGLGALTFNYTFPLLITEAPYNWTATNSGLIALATVIGFGLALPFTPTSDRIAARLTRKNNHIREAEMRLPAIVPGAIISPLGLIVYGLTAERTLHWTGYFAGVAMTQFGSYFFFTFTLAYAVDSYFGETAEMLIAMNLGKQAISFGMGSYLLEWIQTRGYAVVIAGVFCAVAVVNNLMVVVFWVWGKNIRRYTAGSWLGRLGGKRV